MPAYDPVKKCESTPVLRQLNVESAAKRRNFRNAERQRLQALEEIQPQITRTERQHVNIFIKVCCLYVNLIVF